MDYWLSFTIAVVISLLIWCGGYVLGRHREWVRMTRELKDLQYRHDLLFARNKELDTENQLARNHLTKMQEDRIGKQKRKPK